MNNILLIFKGFIIGIAKILPGVSGAVLSISLGIYEKLLEILAHPLKLKIEDLKFLLFLFFGVGLGILVFCIFVKWFLDNHYFPTILLFIGLIIGGFPEITSELKGKKTTILDIIILILSFTVILVLTSSSKNTVTNTNHYFIMGSIESLTTIIPGISGTAIFMALGWYETLLTTINQILTFNAPFSTASTFILGFIISTIAIAKILSFLFKKFKKESYYSVLGFMSGSLFVMLIDAFNKPYTTTELIIGIILLIIGIIFTDKTNKLFDKI